MAFRSGGSAAGRWRLRFRDCSAGSLARRAVARPRHLPARLETLLAGPALAAEDKGSHRRPPPSWICLAENRPPQSALASFSGAALAPGCPVDHRQLLQHAARSGPHPDVPDALVPAALEGPPLRGPVY